MPLKKVDSTARKDVRSQVSSREQWGDRCARCGSTLVHGQPGFHRTYECDTATTIECTTRDVPILTQWTVDPKPRHLLVTSGPQAGKRVCWEWNIRRTANGLCYELNCALHHACSLCLSPHHRALDCDAYSYLPLLPPRPSSLYPANITACQAQWVANRIASRSVPPKYQLKPLKDRFEAPASSNQSTPSPAPAHASVAPSVLVKYKIKDSWWDPVARPEVPAPTGSTIRPRATNIPHLKVPIRDNSDIVDGGPEMHTYPMEVPSCIDPRPRYYGRIPLDEVRDKVPASWLPSFDKACDNASRMVPYDQVDHHEVNARDNRFKVKIFDLQRSVYGRLPTRFDIPSMGITGEKRYQHSDGCCNAAGICYLMHYPPPHRMPFAFTPSRDASGMLLRGGLISPTLSGNWQLCYENTVPLFFAVDETRDSGGKDHDQPISKFDPKIIRDCILHRANEIMDRSSTGTSQWLFTFGETPAKVVDKVIELADKSEFHETKIIEWQCREQRDWELGVVCLRTLLLGQYHHATRRRVDSKGTLFDMHLDGHEAGYVHDDLTKKDLVNPISIIFTLLRDVTKADSCIVMVKADHPTYATQYFKHPELSIGITLDMITTLAEDLFFDRFNSRRFPPPTWRFAHRKKNASLYATETRSDSQTGYHDRSLSVAHRGLLTSLDDHLKKRGRIVNTDGVSRLVQVCCIGTGRKRDSTRSAGRHQDHP